VRKSDLLAELTGVMSDGVAKDLWISIGVDITPWGQYQPLIPKGLKSYHYRPEGRRTNGRPKKRWQEQL
jgi:hypothetical protein